MDLIVIKGFSNLRVYTGMRIGPAGVLSARLQRMVR